MFRLVVSGEKRFSCHVVAWKADTSVEAKGPRLKRDERDATVLCLKTTVCA